ncbi:MAG: helix-turn-helix transcriptional regulator [Gemmatimonadaceae bacterium]
MKAIASVAALLVRARESASLSQRELAERAGTAQSVVARIERGQANPTLDTITRLLAVCGFELTMGIQPLASRDALIDAYKRDVDRSLLRENIRRDVTTRLRMNAELNDFARQAARGVRRRGAT